MLRRSEASKAKDMNTGLNTKDLRLGGLFHAVHMYTALICALATMLLLS